MSNRSDGIAFEKELCRRLAEHGFFAHNVAQRFSGQPFDVYASRNGVTYPIDCKICCDNVFRLARIEENQELAMTRWKYTGNGPGFFALRFSDGSIYMISFSSLKWLRDNMGRSYVNRIVVEANGRKLEEWISRCK